jgi:hypothetical protein
MAWNVKVLLLGCAFSLGLVGCATVTVADRRVGHDVRPAVVERFRDTVIQTAKTAFGTEEVVLCLPSDPRALCAVIRPMSADVVVVWYRCTEGPPLSCKRDPRREALEALSEEEYRHEHPGKHDHFTVGTTSVKAARLIGATRQDVASLLGAGTRCDAPETLCARDEDRPTDWFYPLKDVVWKRADPSLGRGGTLLRSDDIFASSADSLREDGVALVVHFGDDDRCLGSRWSFVATASSEPQ